MQSEACSVGCHLSRRDKDSRNQETCLSQVWEEDVVPQAGVFFILGSVHPCQVTTLPVPPGSDFVSRRKDAAATERFWLFNSSFWDLKLPEGNEQKIGIECPNLLLAIDGHYYNNKSVLLRSRDKSLLNTSDLPFGYSASGHSVSKLSIFFSVNCKFCKAGTHLLSLHLTWYLVCCRHHSFIEWLNEWMDELVVSAYSPGTF